MKNKSFLELSIIIVNYNTRDFLVQCLASIYEQTHNVNFEVILVDNCSCDGSVSEVKQRFPQIKLILNKNNVGFAAANNQGLRIMKGEYVLLLNPDTVVLDGALNKMVHFMQTHSKAGIIGCKIFNADGSLQRAAFPPPSLAISIISKLNVETLSSSKSLHRYYTRHLDRLFPAHLSNRYYDNFYEVNKEPFKVGWVSGACLLIRRQVLDEVGLMDEKLFLFAEDADICTRARKKGWEVMLFPGAQIIHYGGQSTEKNLATSITSSHFSRFHFAKKHFGKIAMWILKVICFLELSIKFLVIAVKPGMDRKERKSRLKGYMDSFRLIFQKVS